MRFASPKEAVEAGMFNLSYPAFDGTHWEIVNGKIWTL